MKVLLLSRYGYLGASSRYRSYQYLPFLRQQGFEIKVAPLLDDNYIQKLYSGQRSSLFRIAFAYLKRISNLMSCRNYDLIWIEKEAFPWIIGSIEAMLLQSNIPYIVDYDDATFHRYDQHNSPLVRRLLGRKIDRIMSNAALVIVGNDYLAERASSAGANRIEILPTVVDLARYPITPYPKNSTFVIGWIGSPLRASAYFKAIQPALKEICKDGSARVVAIGAGKMELEEVPLEIRPWSEATEVSDMQQFNVGIMPLTDTPFEKGKCGLKLIQYMACARPAIGSPVGVNQKIIDSGINGFVANSTEEWFTALQKLKNEPEVAQQMGVAGRSIVEEKYSLKIAVPKLVELLLQSAKRSVV